MSGKSPSIQEFEGEAIKAVPEEKNNQAIARTGYASGVMTTTIYTVPVGFSFYLTGFFMYAFSSPGVGRFLIASVTWQEVSPGSTPQILSFNYPTPAKYNAGTTFQTQSTSSVGCRITINGFLVKDI